jgi:hypothetical protein
MRKINILGLALVAVFAFGAVAVSAAFAEEALWLLNGNDITTAISSEAKGTLWLTDLSAPFGAVMVVCNGSFDGTVGPGMEDEITAVLNSNKELVAGTVAGQDLILCGFLAEQHGACKTTPEADVETVGLPWKTLVELNTAGTGFVDLITSASGKVGYRVTCKNVLEGETTDECTVAEGVSELTNVETGVLGIFKEANTGSCTASGSKSGDVEEGGITIATGGGTLSVSEP